MYFYIKSNCKRTLQLVRQLVMEIVVLYFGIFQRQICLFILVVVLYFSEYWYCWMCYKWAITKYWLAKWKSLHHKCFYKMQYVIYMFTNLTIGFKLNIFEFGLASYQWGNSWCLYSLHLIGCWLGWMLFKLESFEHIYNHISH